MKHIRKIHKKRTISIVLIIAAILVGAGIFSFIASNWQGMSNTGKVSVIVIFMLISYTLGWYFKEKMALTKTGDAFILLGAIIYGAGIFLIAQMFHIRANWPDGFILWMFGTIAVAFAMESFGLFYPAIFLGLIAVSGHPFGIVESFGADVYLFTSSLLLILATIVTFVSGYVIRRKIPAEYKKIYGVTLIMK